MILSYDETANRFFVRPKFKNRDIPRRHGFTWDQTGKRYITHDSLHALALSQAATTTAVLPEAWKRIRPYFRNLAASYADSNFLGPYNNNSFPYQDAAVYYAANKNVVLLGDEMGLGKTIEALVILNQRKAERVLIISPAVMRGTWLEEIETWSPQFNGRVQAIYSVEQFEAEGILGANVVVCSFDLFSKLQDKIAQYSFDHLVIDEIHYCKTDGNNRTEAIIAQGLRTPKIIMLSGTYPPNNPAELWPILNTFAPAITGHMSYWQFVNKYCIVEMRHVKYTPKGTKQSRTKKIRKICGGKNLEALGYRMRATIMCRRLLEDVRPDILPPIMKLVKVPSGPFKARLKEESPFRQRVIDELASDATDLPKKYRGTDFATVQRLMAIEKVPFVIEHAKKQLETRDKLLIVGYHTEALDLIAAGLSEYNAVVMRGNTTDKVRNQIKKKFQNEKDIRVIVGQIKVIGVGLTLTAAAMIMFSEGSWVPGDNKQAIARVRRHGQVEQVIAYFLVVEESLDAIILARALDKQSGLNKLLDSRQELTRW